MTPSASSTVLWSLISLLLRPLHAVTGCLVFLLSPLTLLVSLFYHAIVQAVSFPVRILVRFESLYVFCGCAVIIGLVLGSCTALISHFMKDCFGVSEGYLDDAPLPMSSHAVGSPEESHLKTPSDGKPLSPPISTILEEEDEDCPVGYMTYRMNGKPSKRLEPDYGVRRDLSWRVPRR